MTVVTLTKHEPEHGHKFFTLTITHGDTFRTLKVRAYQLSDTKIMVYVSPRVSHEFPKTILVPRRVRIGELPKQIGETLHNWFLTQHLEAAGSSPEQLYRLFPDLRGFAPKQVFEDDAVS